MTIKATGTLSVEELNIEVGRATNAAFSMDDTVMRVLAGVSSGPYSWNNFYGKSYEIVFTVTTNTSNLILKNCFTTAVWGDVNIPKRVVIDTGVTISGTAQTYALAPTDTASGQAGSWAGSLILENKGTISGIGGVINSGVGGDAIWMNFPGRTSQLLSINNFGTIRGGGGGGGRGGTGGDGSYQTPYTFTEGPRYDTAVPLSHWDQGNPGAFNTEFYWKGTRFRPADATSTTIVIGAFTYIRGTLQAGNRYSLSRSETLYNTVITAGGAGGNGGRGQGDDGANTVGVAGVAGGTNAGAGSTGGTGGGWGAQGNTGVTGGNGNAGVGLVGATGGAAGFYINGNNRVTLNNTGTVQGRIGSL